MRRLLWVFAFVGIGAACGARDDGASTVGSGSDAGASTSTAAVTFHRDVEPLLQSRCQSCHTPGGIGPFSLLSYEDARSHASRIVTETSARRMPPWGARVTSECKPPHGYVGDPSLTDAELALLAAWRDAGAPEGDPKDAPPPRAAVAIPGFESPVSLTPDQAFTATGDTDTLRCFVLDPKIQDTRFIRGTFFAPSNPSVVHHALAYAIPANATVPGDVYDCFGGPGVKGASLVAAWAPGGVPTVYPKDVALPVQAGTRFVMQVHYHPHANASPEPDRTAFQVSYATGIPAYVVLTYLIGNFAQPVDADGAGLLPGPNDPPSGPEFLVPKDTKGHVEKMQFVVPSTYQGKAVGELRVLGVGAHMHLVGVDERISLTPKDGSGEVCLLHEPAWSFDWQRGYAFDAPIESLPKVVPGDRFDFRCTYDNTKDNPALLRAMTEARVPETAPVHLGESTLDEMCLGAFSFVRKLIP